MARQQPTDADPFARLDITHQQVKEHVENLPRDELRRLQEGMAPEDPNFPVLRQSSIDRNAILPCRIPLPVDRKAAFITKMRWDEVYFAEEYSVNAHGTINEVKGHELWAAEERKGMPCHVRIPKSLAWGYMPISREDIEWHFGHYPVKESEESLKEIFPEIMYHCVEILPRGQDMRSDIHWKRNRHNGRRWTFVERRRFVRRLALWRIHCLQITRDTIGAVNLDPPKKTPELWFQPVTCGMTKIVLNPDYYPFPPYQDTREYVYAMLSMHIAFHEKCPDDFYKALQSARQRDDDDAELFRSRKGWLRYLRDLKDNVLPAHKFRSKYDEGVSALNKKFYYTHRDIPFDNNMMVNENKLPGILDFESSSFLPYSEAIADLYMQDWHGHLSCGNVDVNEWHDAPVKPFGDDVYQRLEPDLEVFPDGRFRSFRHYLHELNIHHDLMKKEMRRLRYIPEEFDFGRLTTDDLEYGDPYSRDRDFDDEVEVEDSPGAYFDSDDENEGIFTGSFRGPPVPENDVLKRPMEEQWWRRCVWRMVDDFVMTHMGGQALDKWRDAALFVPCSRLVRNGNPILKIKKRKRRREERAGSPRTPKKPKVDGGPMSEAFATLYPSPGDPRPRARNDMPGT